MHGLVGLYPGAYIRVKISYGVKISEKKTFEAANLLGVMT